EVERELRRRRGVGEDDAGGDDSAQHEGDDRQPQEAQTRTWLFFDIGHVSAFDREQSARADQFFLSVSESAESASASESAASSASSVFAASSSVVVAASASSLASSVKIGRASCRDRGAREVGG